MSVCHTWHRLYGFNFEMEKKRMWCVLSKSTFPMCFLKEMRDSLMKYIFRAQKRKRSFKKVLCDVEVYEHLKLCKCYASGTRFKFNTEVGQGIIFHQFAINETYARIVDLLQFVLRFVSVFLVIFKRFLLLYKTYSRIRWVKLSTGLVRLVAHPIEYVGRCLYAKLQPTSYEDNKNLFFRE